VITKLLIVATVLLVTTIVVLASGSVLVGPQPCDRFVPVDPEQAAQMNRRSRPRRISDQASACRWNFRK